MLGSEFIGEALIGGPAGVVDQGLTGTSSGSSTASASLAPSYQQLAATSSGASTVAVDLLADRGLTGSSTGASTTTSAVVVGGIYGYIAGASTTTALVAVTVALRATPLGYAAVTGDLTVYPYVAPTVVPVGTTPAFQRAASDIKGGLAMAVPGFRSSR